MNKPNINKKPLRGLVSVCAIAALAGALLATTAGVASADYGPGAVYQIELVDGDNGASTAPVGSRGSATLGGGIWLWIALYPAVDPVTGTLDYTHGTGDYSGSDCLDSGGTIGLHGAYKDVGDVTWQLSTDCSFLPPGCSLPSTSWAKNYTGSCIKISGVHISGIELAFQTFLGITFQTTITVPATYGNYTGTNGTFLSFSDFSNPLPPGVDVLDPCGGTSRVQVAP